MRTLRPALLATVLVQSSSVSTATIVGMVGAGTLPFAIAVPMIMGANIGTTVTSTLAALGSIRRAEEFRKAFAAATMHDFFNLMSVAILLPIELATGVLSRIALALTDVLRGAEFSYDEPGRSPIRTVVKLPVDFLEGVLPEGRVIGFLLIALALALDATHGRRATTARLVVVSPPSRTDTPTIPSLPTTAISAESPFSMM